MTAVRDIIQRVIPATKIIDKITLTGSFKRPPASEVHVQSSSRSTGLLNIYQQIAGSADLHIIPCRARGSVQAANVGLAQKRRGAIATCTRRISDPVWILVCTKRIGGCLLRARRAAGGGLRNTSCRRALHTTYRRRPATILDRTIRMENESQCASRRSDSSRR